MSASYQNNNNVMTRPLAIFATILMIFGVIALSSPS